MGKKCRCKTAAEIPAWFLTYSDVITLLMTFFILLLTFATQEPENFAQMKTSMFGAGGGTGMAGEKAESLDQDSLVLRERPQSSRLTLEGSEIPPTYSDPAYESVSAGVAALDDPEAYEQFQKYDINLSLPLLVENQTELTALGRQQVRMIGRQLVKLPLLATFEVGTNADLEAATALALGLTKEPGLQVGRTAVSLTSDRKLPPGTTRLTLLWDTGR